MPGARAFSAGTEALSQPMTFAPEDRAAAAPLLDASDAEADARESRRYLLLLVAITIIGGIFRFTMLASPTIWGDEANTYSRVAGSYETMLDLLQDAGFAPLHYEAEWVIGRFFKLTPAALRFFPALC